MSTPVRRILSWFAFFTTLLLAVVVVNQVLQLAEFGARIHPRVGDGVFWGIVFVLGFTLAVPLVLVARLPKPLVPPAQAEGPEFEEHVRRLGRRLQANPRLAGRSLGAVAEVEEALRELDSGATGVIRQAGSRAFILTAISQNGALDALIVLGIQARLVWDVAHVYQQRPGLREMTTLYANVLATALIAAELDDADLAEALQPALAAASGSVVGAVPGLGGIGTLAGNAILSGTGNAFLTLRVGIIAREQSRALVRLPRRTLRRLAVVQAGAMLAGITSEGGRKVAGIITQQAWAGAVGLASGVGRAVAATPGAVGRGVVSASGGMARGVTSASEAVGDAVSSASEAALDALRQGTERVSEPLRRAMDRVRRREKGVEEGGAGEPGAGDGPGGAPGRGPGEGGGAGGTPPDPER
jgi:hypothetical protein